MAIGVHCKGLVRRLRQGEEDHRDAVDLPAEHHVHRIRRRGVAPQGVDGSGTVHHSLDRRFRVMRQRGRDEAGQEMRVGGQPGGIGGVEADHRVRDRHGDHPPTAKGQPRDRRDILALVARPVQVDVEPEVGHADVEGDGSVAKLGQGDPRTVHVRIKPGEKGGKVGGHEGTGGRVLRDWQAEDRQFRPV